jgi:autotransporter-associated beta strand protein
LKVFSRCFIFHVFIGFILFCCLAGNLRAQTSPIVFSNNAGYCWYQDERAIINNNQLIFASVPYPSGDNDVITYNLSSGTITTFDLHAALNADDHSAAAFMVRPDGKILAVYCTHGNDSLVRYRITTNPGDTSSWSAEQTYTVTSNYGATYSNVYQLNPTGTAPVTYDFYRGQNYQPNVLISYNNGSSWSDGGHVVVTSVGTRPYAKYASNGTDKIWFTYTDGHPDEVTISNIYAAYLQGSNIYNSYGTLIGSLPSGITPGLGTKVYTADSTHHAWTSDIQLDSNGYPVLAYTVRIGSNGSGGSDSRYRYSRFDGTTWHDYQIAYAGSCLYSSQPSYTGLISLNASDPNTLYISTNADPVTGAALTSSADGKRHWEVYRGFTDNNGASWTWTPITANSTLDNIRPNLPVWDTQNTALYWLKGTYTSYTNYNMSAVGYVFSGANGIWSNIAGGDWTSGGNWQSGLIASGKLGIADFSTLDISGTAAVQLNGSRTLGTLVFKDTNTSSSGNWVVNPGSGGTITLENVGAARPSITVQNQTAAINVPLAGTQGVDVKGNGTLILGAACVYSGGTTIYAGSTLQVGDGGALPVAGAVVNNASLVFNSSGSVALNGAISGSGMVTQNGSGTVVLGGSNTYSGATNVNDGVLQATYSTALGNATGAVNIAGGASDGRLEITGGLNLTKNVILAGRGSTHGENLASHLTNVSGANTLNGNISLTVGGYDYLIQSNADALTINGSITNNTSNTTPRYLYLQGDGNGSVAGTISSGDGSGTIDLIKDGAGSWTLTQDITYTGNTTVLNGILEVANFNPATANTALVDVEAGAQLIADSIMVNTLTIGAGGTVTIRAIDTSTSLATASVPEPISFLLLMSGMAFCCAYGIIRNKQIGTGSVCAKHTAPTGAMRIMAGWSGRSGKTNPSPLGE